MKKEQRDVIVHNLYQIRTDVPAAGISIDEYLKWRAFINYINTEGEADPNRVGSSYGALYGIVDRSGWSASITDGPTNIQYDSLDSAIEELGITLDFNADDYIELYDRKIVLNDLEKYAEITSDDSAYTGCFANIDDITYLSDDYGGGTALNSECSSLYDDGNDYFVTDKADEYDLRFSSWHGYYVDINDDYVQYGVVSTNGGEDWFCNCDYVYCEDNSTYYINNHVAEHFDVYYNESRNAYCFRDDDYDDESDDGVACYNASYHSGLERRVIDGNADWKIGFEIEKEDDEAGMIHYRQLYDRTYWCKESDGSLDSNTGYELISPVYDLFGKNLDLAIKDPDIETLINGDHSNNCGGHIHVSCQQYNTEQLFEGFSGFYPLLYALYEWRVDKSYCAAKKKHEYYRKDKYSAVYIRDNTVEFRIFSAVKNVSNMLWRRDLVRIMADNFNKSEFDVLKMMVNPNSKLYKHLRKIFPQDRMMEKVRLFVKYADLYGNKKLPMPKQGPKDNLSNTEDLGA
jgi:hypothetical protein